MSPERFRPWRSTVYCLFVGILGLALLALQSLGVSEAVPWPAWAAMLVLSVVTKRLGFQVARQVTHSLVGVIDLAALFVFGPLGGGIVAAGSGAICQVLCARQTAEAPRQTALCALFAFGLNAIMALAADAAYRLFGGRLPLVQLTWALMPAVVAASLAWFVLDHLGWTVRLWLEEGWASAMRFLRDILPYSVTVELLPLPFSPLVSTAYGREDRALAALTVLAIVGVSLVLRRLRVSLMDERRHVRELSQSTRQLTMIAEVSRKVAAILDLRELLQDTVRLVQQSFGYYLVSVFSVDAEKQQVIFRASSSEAVHQRGVTIPWGKGLVGDAASTGKVARCNDVLHDARFLPDTALDQTRAELSVPLNVENRTLGVLDVQSDHRDAFGDREVYVLQALADQVAIAVEDSRLYEALQEQAWVSTALLQVAESVGRVVISDEILETVVRLTPMLTGVAHCLVFLWSDEEQAYTAVQSAGLSREQAVALSHQCFTPEALPCIDQARLEGHPVHLRLSDLARFLPPPVEGLGSDDDILAVPLRTKGQVIGVMVAGPAPSQSAADEGRIPRHRETILTGIANHAAMALENARLFASQQEETWVTNALLQIANMVTSTTGLNETLSAVARLTPILTGADWCAILLWDEAREAYFCVRAHGLPKPLAVVVEGHYLAAETAPLLSACRDAHESITRPAGELSSMASGWHEHGLDLGTVTASPLRAHERFLGVLLSAEADEQRQLVARRRTILYGIANQTALAIEASRLYDQTLRQERLHREIELARDIQASFLPEGCPELPGWEVAVEWRAAEGVGGDFYDFIYLDSRHLGLLIADVSDKGVAAALYMALSRTVVRTAAIGELSPVVTLRRANRVLMEESRSGMFLGMFYGILDLERGLLEYARAGHSPPLLLRAADGTIEELNASGVVLGILEDPQIEGAQVQIEAGDLLACYTDGVTEAINEAEEQFGEERLRHILSGAPRRSAQDVIDAVVASVRVFAGERSQFDDLTLLVLRRRG